MLNMRRRTNLGKNSLIYPQLVIEDILALYKLTGNYLVIDYLRRDF